MVYLGHIPHGFYEEQMKGYFSQFGDVVLHAALRPLHAASWRCMQHYSFCTQHI